MRRTLIRARDFQSDLFHWKRSSSFMILFIPGFFFLFIPPSELNRVHFLFDDRLPSAAGWLVPSSGMFGEPCCSVSIVAVVVFLSLRSTSPVESELPGSETSSDDDDVICCALCASSQLEKSAGFTHLSLFYGTGGWPRPGRFSSHVPTTL